MVAETYNDVATYMQAKNVTLVAKSSGYDVKKEAADGFVKRGEEVTFTITTTFPSFTVADSEDNTFKIQLIHQLVWIFKRLHPLRLVILH